MKEEYEVSFEKSLDKVPGGTFELKRHNAEDTHSPLLVEQFTTQTKGKGRIESFLLFPGIELSFHQYLAEHVRFHHEPKDSVLEINHCHKGRIGWNMREGAAIYLGVGDLCLHSMASCADSEMTLPLGYYEGVSVTVDLLELKTNCPEILQEAGFDAKAIYQKFCVEGSPFGITSNSSIDNVFSALYTLPERLRIPYYKLKAQEILLFLLQLKPTAEKKLTQYGSQQTELIKDVRNFLIQHLDQRFTIEELAKKYLLNTSSLKAVFKAVYGMPIASYVKEYRMRQAMTLLRETDDSIAIIAEKVGYETQGKFTKAFKEKVQMLPTEYRKLYWQG